MKINADFKAFAAVQFDSTKYIASPSNGISRFMLDRVGNEKARATTIVEYKPNSKFPMHEHFGGEEFLVLEGTFKDQYGEFGSGTYVRNPIGSKHSPWVDDDGCTIMVKLLQMAETEGEGVEPLHVHYDGENEDKRSTEWGCRIDMYHNVQTGENVSMCWIDPRQELPTNGYCNNGEELFVVEGSLFLSTGTEYNKCASLRFPASNETVPERKGLKAGPNGAQVYRKTGHLSETAMGMEKIQISMDTEEIIP
ncbi:chrR cupin-like domain containing protein [Nitzschia inconspicua]|uniref:ChrR cupin-like domain containing protein n=1 Tax=Nitzschia inconspicua TaxID=303405 RepID=A0A9K3LJ45_9STRA|nr:chrR cupin-like domain containing protein [Nitzschia inconspicua]